MICMYYKCVNFSKNALKILLVHIDNYADWFARTLIWVQIEFADYLIDYDINGPYVLKLSVFM